MDKIKGRLNIWKGSFLSLARRICLIKPVFTTLPLFYLSFYKAPESVYKRITNIQRRFLCGWGKENTTILWVSWENLCKPKAEGGLGFKKVRRFNIALLTKWKWRLESVKNGKWKDILLSKYETDLG